MTSLPYSRSRRTAFIRSGRAGGLAGEVSTAAGRFLCCNLLPCEWHVYSSDLGVDRRATGREDWHQGSRDHARSFTDDLMRLRGGGYVALKHPLVGLGMCICCPIVYLRPEPPWTDNST